MLFLTDPIVLPGMVVPIELDESAQAAIDAARGAGPAARREGPPHPAGYAANRGVGPHAQVGRDQLANSGMSRRGWRRASRDSR